MKIINFRYFPILCLFLIGGICLGYFFWYDKISIIFALSASVLLIALILILYKRIKTPLILISMFIIFILGVLLTVGYVHSAVYGVKEERIVAEIRVNNIGEFGELDVTFSSQEFSGNAVVYTSEDIEFQMGDKISALVEISTTDVMDENYNLNESYFIFGEKYEGYICEIYDISHGALTVTESIKNSLDDGLEVLGENKASAYALLTGDKYALTNEVYDNFKISGLAHILAVSGQHIVILATAVIWLLRKLKCNRFAILGIVGVALLFYTALCDFTPSVVRAFIMMLVYLVAQCTGRETDILSSTCFAAIILLLISPFNLFSVGFLLSFGAVIAIAVLAPLIKPIFKWLPNWLNDLFSTSLAVNIFVFPIMAEYFGTISVFFLLANVLVLPIMAVGFIVLVAGAILYLITTLKFFFYPGGIFVSYLNTIAEEVAHLPYAQINVASIGVFAILFYFLILLFSNFVMLKMRNKLITAGISIITFVPLAILL